MRSTRWETEAVGDLEAALAYIALDNRAAALQLEERVRATVELLAERSIGRRTRLPGIYQKIVLKTPYTTLYTADERQLTILRVVHQKREQGPGEITAG